MSLCRLAVSPKHTPGGPVLSKKKTGHFCDILWSRAVAKNGWKLRKGSQAYAPFN